MKDGSGLPARSTPAALRLPLFLPWWAPLTLDEAEPTVIIAEAPQREAPDAGATSAAVTSVLLDDRLPASAGVADVVEQVAGTTVHSLGGLGDFSAVSIRGSSLRQVAVYLDGVPLNPDGSDTVNLSELPASAFARVDLYRGNAPPRYAASPVGGVIDLVPASRPVAPTTRSSVGSFGTLRQSALVSPQGQSAWGPHQSLLAAELFSTQGDWVAFDDNGTAYNLIDDHRVVRHNNDKVQGTLLLRHRVETGPWRFTLLDSAIRRREGLPGPVHDPAAQAHLATDRNLAVLEARRAGPDGLYTIRAYTLRRREDWRDPEGELGAAAEARRSTSLSDGLLLSGLWAPREGLLPGVTLSLRQDRFRAEDLDTGATDEGRHRESLSAALHADLRQGPLTWSPVLAGQGIFSHRLSTAPFANNAVAAASDPSLFSFDPRLGLLYRPIDGLAVKANAGRYLRPPDLTELFGDRGAVQGNAQLRPERGRAADVGLRAQSPDAAPVEGSVDLTHFWTDTTDSIIYFQNAQRVLTPVNVGRAWVQGLEANLSLEAADVLSLQGSVTRVTSRNLSPQPAVANKQLPRVPTVELAASTSLHQEERWRLGHTWSYTSGNYWDAINAYAAAPRSLHGVFVRFSPGSLSYEIEALNLFDKTVEAMPRDPFAADSPLAIRPLTDFAGYPLPGRTLVASLRWRGPTPEAS